MVEDRQPEFRVEHQHAGGKVGQDVLEAGLCGLQLESVGLDHLAGFVELARHAVERLEQHAELVAAGDRHAPREIPACHRLRRLREFGQRRRHAVGQDESERHGGEQRHQQCQREGNDVAALQSLAGQRELLVIPVDRLDRLRAPRERLGHRVAQLQVACLVGNHRAGDRNDGAQAERFSRQRVDRREAAIVARLAQLQRAGQLGHQLREVVTPAGNEAPAGSDNDRVLDPGLLAQAVERNDLLAVGAVGELERHGLCLDVQFRQHLVHRRLSELDAAFQCAIHADIEPGFDALREELHRYRVYEHTGHHCDGSEQDKEAEREARTENLLLQATAQRSKLVADQGKQRGGEDRVEPEKHRVVFGEERRIGACRSEQEKQHACEGHTQDQQGLHRAPSSRFSGAVGEGCWAEERGRHVKRFQSESRCHSRLVRALTWKGLGRSVRSRRMRTAAW